MKLRQNGTVSFLIRLADFQARGGARVKHTIRYHIEKYLTRTQSSQRIFKIFFLGDLCVLCGELLCFFHDQSGRSRPGGARMKLHQFLFRSVGPFFWQAAGLTSDIRNLHFLTTCRQIKPEKGLI